MTRARRPAAKRTPAPAKPAPPDSLSARANMQRALDEARSATDARAPSLQIATEHPVEDKRYTEKERELASMAMDFNGTQRNSLTFVAATSFPGFPTLALLAQLPEHRTMHETLADECIRTWGKVTSSGEADPETLAELEAELKRFDVRAVARQLVIDDQRFGGSHCYFKLKGDEDFRDTPLVLKKYSVPKGSFEGFRVIEPYWVTPNYYNSIDPTAADFYKPSSWWTLGYETHATRLQTLISRPVPDMLKPTYSFRGISMTQLAAPYVDNWLRTRQSVSDTVKQFSVSGVLADLQQSLLPGAQVSLNARAELINVYRDNRNLLLLDKATEEFFQVNTPLSGLDALQAQAQEQMGAVSHIPLVKLLGISPAGLNASSEGEIKVFYDFVQGYRTNFLTAFMLNALRIIQLSKFSQIDEQISWEWLPLEELSALEAADARSKDGETDIRYVENGIISPEQVAKRLNSDPKSIYAGVLDTGETLETTADTDVASITAHILQIDDGTGGPLLEKDPVDEGVEAILAVSQNAGGEEEQPGVEAELEAEASNGEHESAMSLEDPSPNDDPGALQP